MWIGLPSCDADGCVEFLRRDRAQRMRCDAGGDAARHRLAQVGVVVDREHEAALSLGRRRAAELRTAIQHGQQRQADAGALRRGHDAMREFRRIGIARTVRRVVQVVELGDRGVAVQQALHVELRRDRLDVIGGQDREEAVHHLAPAPEIVALGSRAFGQARHRTLEGVRVEVRHAWDDEARQAFGVFGGLRELRSDDAVRADVDQHAVCYDVRPTVRHRQVAHVDHRRRDSAVTLVQTISLRRVERAMRSACA